MQVSKSVTVRKNKTKKKPSRKRRPDRSQTVTFKCVVCTKRTHEPFRVLKDSLCVCSQSCNDSR